ncbi:hypothetical protein [Rosenbergiella collisarenosi]|uniref:hypothetical protein n=1 Tax=Rosenbergiella collisarenosi TaxID=1544695 RepID=UPI001F4ED93D|nr:hypothetical protein [Rosenbergiella collisarenosi]
MITFEKIIEDNISIINAYNTVLTVYVIGLLFLAAIGIIVLLISKFRNPFIIMGCGVCAVIFSIVYFIFMMPEKEYATKQIATLNVLKNSCKIDSYDTSHTSMNLRGLMMKHKNIESLNLDCNGKKQTVRL